MPNVELVFRAVSKTCGISKTRMKSPSRKWPISEARLLFILFLHNQGCADNLIASALNRSRSGMVRLRRTAVGYMEISRSFREKYDIIVSEYEAG